MKHFSIDKFEHGQKVIVRFSKFAETAYLINIQAITYPPTVNAMLREDIQECEADWLIVAPDRPDIRKALPESFTIRMEQ